MRTFIAIDIPEEIKEKIISIQKKLPEFEGKNIERENLHLTLKFLGEVDENKIEKIKRKLKEIKFKSFETELDSLGFFDNRKSYRSQLIIWLHMTNCENLQKEVDNQLKGLFERVHSVPSHSPLTKQMKERRFMAHLTIARIKRIKNDKKFFSELKKIKIPKMSFVVENFNLKSSIVRRPGPVYKDIEIYK